jgi:hypothetical protein
MSGGHFDYSQYKIQEIADSVEQEIINNGRLKTKKELKEEDRWYNRDDEYYQKYPEELSYHSYPEDIIEKFKEAVYILRKACIYAQRIDWFLSGDDGEDSFRERLVEELNKLGNNE